MGHLYCFTSSISNDEVITLNIFTNSVKHAYVLAIKYFQRNSCKGFPKLLAI